MSEKYPMAQAVREAYQAGEDDETLEPRVLVDPRGEREVELCQSLLDAKFNHFPVAGNLHLNMVAMIPYHLKLSARVAFSPEEEIRHTLSETLSKHGLRQVKISESEKAIHVSFFLNGKIRESFKCRNWNAECEMMKNGKSGKNSFPGREYIMG